MSRSRFRTSSSLGYSSAYSSGLSGSYGTGLTSSGYFSPTLGSGATTSGIGGNAGYSTTTSAYLGRLGSSYGTGTSGTTAITGTSGTGPYSSSYGTGSRSLGYTSSATNNDYTPTGSNSFSSPRRRYGGATTESNLSDRINGVQLASPGYGTKSVGRSTLGYRGSRSHSELSPTGVLDVTGPSSPLWRPSTSASNEFDRYKGPANVEGTSYVNQSSRGRSTTRDDYSIPSGGRDRDLSLSRDTSYRNVSNDRYAFSDNGRDDYTRDFDHYNYSGGVGSSNRDRSLTRDPYTPSRDYYTNNGASSSSAATHRNQSSKRNDSFDDDPYMNGADGTSTPPSRGQRDRDFYSSKSKSANKSSYEVPNIDTRPSPRRKEGNRSSSKMVRSSSYKDLRDLETESRSRAMPRNRARHRTLAYGVSASDLEMARTPSRGSGLNDFASDWRTHSQVPLVGSAMHDFRGSNPELRGFASDMSMGPGHQSGNLPVSSNSNSMHSLPSRDSRHAQRQHKKSSRSRKSSTDQGYDSPSRSASTSLKSLIPPSLTIAALEKEARDCSGSMITSSDQGRNLRSSSDRSVSIQSRASSDDELIVLRKDDLNTLLTAKPTVLIGRELSLSTDGARQSGSSTLGAAAKSNSSHNQNGADVDYKKLWEESQKENGRLREDLDKVKGDLTHTRRQLDGAKTSTSGSSGTGLSDAEKREKKALERKLSEMEEELKLLALSENLTDQQLEHLKNDNQRLRDENGALIRVISKLSK